MSDRQYWQVAAGSAGRNYAEAFLKYGLAFVGGDAHIVTMARVQVGDIVILKDGLSKILAAGEVVDRGGSHQGSYDKEWLRDFDGWDLPAWCNVDWRVADPPIRTSGLTRTTIQRTHQEAHQKIADRLLQGEPVGRQPEPKATKEVSDDQILKFLITKGLRPGAADQLTDTLRRIRLLAEYYYHNCAWKDIREHETRTFLIVPLLLALGWAEQQMKIEYPVKGGRVDLLCFSAAQHEDGSECQLILESKDFSSGLDYAPGQARQYARSFPSCRVMVVSNGYCYKAYKRDGDGSFALDPFAYINLTRPRDRYPLDPDNVDGALGLFDALLPRTRL